MHIYILNLDRCVDRLIKMTSRLNKLGLSFQRWPAVSPPIRNGVMTAGAFGCALSHYNILLDAKKHGYKDFVVFEDDVIIRDDFVLMRELMLKQVAHLQWDIFYFGTDLKQPPVMISENVGSHHGCHTHAYSVSFKSLDKVIESTSLNILSGRKQIDGGWSCDNSLVRFCAVPILAIQENGVSTVGNDARKRISDYFRFFDKDEFIRNCRELQK